MTDLVKIEGYVGTLTAEYDNGRSVEIGRVHGIQHVGHFQERPHGLKGIIRPGVLYFRTEEPAILSEALDDAYRTDKTIHWHLAVDGGDTYEFAGAILPGDTSEIQIAGKIKRML